MFSVAGSSKDENKENEPIVIDSAIEIALLNQTIADLKAKIEEAKDLEEEKQQIENGTSNFSFHYYYYLKICTNLIICYRKR